MRGRKLNISLVFITESYFPAYSQFYYEISKQKRALTNHI